MKIFDEVDSLKNEPASLTNPTNISDHEKNQSRLQLLAQAIETVESESSHKKRSSIGSSPLCNKPISFPFESLQMNSSFPTGQTQEFLMQLLSQQNVAAVMAAAAAAAAQLQVQQQKPEPISPPSTSSASSSIESPIDFSSRRSTDETPTDYSSPSSPNGQLLSNMLQNIQSNNSLTNNNFPLLLTNKNGKPTRPFKAYPRDPLMLPIGFCSTTTSEQNNLLGEAIMRATNNRKRLGTSQDRQKQHQSHSTPTTNTHFISSAGTQILQPPKKRHRVMENPTLQHEELNSNKQIQNESNNLVKDDAYWERRRKNNEAAKRSRDARRIKEDEIAIRAALLEQENLKLRLEVSQLKQETAKLRCMIQANS